MIARAATGGIPPGRFPDPSGKYPFIGPNYQKHKELAGYIYNPYTDRYRADPEAAGNLGLGPKKPKDPSMLESVAPIAVGAGALAVGKEIGSGAAFEPEGLLGSKGPIRGGLGDLLGGSEKAPATSVANVPTGGSSAATAVGTGPVQGSTIMSDGSVLMPDGSVMTDSLPVGSEVLDDGSIIDSKTGTTIGRIGQGAIGAYQIFQGFNEFKDDKIGGGLGMASGAANVLAASGVESAAPIAGPLQIVKGGYDVFDSLQHGGENIRGSMAGLGAGIGTMILPGVGTVAGALIGNAAGYGLDKLGIAHETTRQRAKRHTEELSKQGAEDEAWQRYLAGMREQYNYDPPDKDNPYGEYGSWEEAEEAGLDPATLTGVYGNLKTYGPLWASLTQEQRIQVTRLNINDGLYNSRKGEVEITDEQKAKANLDKVLKGKTDEMELEDGSDDSTGKFPITNSSEQSRGPSSADYLPPGANPADYPNVSTIDMSQAVPYGSLPQAPIVKDPVTGIYFKGMPKINTL